MLNPITFTVEAESGPLAVTASGLDYAAYENTYDRTVISALGERRYTAWCFLVWHAMFRQDLTKQTFDEFLATTPQFDSSGEAEDIVPLESTVPTGQ
jgi:hypothetical protein